MQHKKGLPVLFSMWAILSFCLVVGLSVVAIDRVAANDFRIANVDLIELTGPATSLSGEAESDLAPTQPLPAVDGPAVRYAGTSWLVTSSRLIPRAEQETGRPIVVAEVLVRNISGRVTTRTRAADVTLLWPDGYREPADRFEFTDNARLLVLEPGAAEVVTLVFKPSIGQDPDLSDLVIEVGESGRVPAVIPLVGSAPEPNYPLIGSIGPPAGSADRPSGALPVTFDRVVVDVDAGPYRAATGQHLVVVDVTVDVEGAAELDLWDRVTDRSDSGYWSLDVDGQSIEPDRIETDPAQRRSPRSATLIFVVDDSVTEAVLVANADGDEPIRFDLGLPVPTLTTR